MLVTLLLQPGSSALCVAGSSPNDLLTSLLLRLAYLAVPLR